MFSQAPLWLSMGLGPVKAVFRSMYNRFYWLHTALFSVSNWETGPRVSIPRGTRCV